MIRILQQHKEREGWIQEGSFKFYNDLKLLEDIPIASVKPLENVLFVCKLSVILEEGDLKIIFGSFGQVKCHITIRDF